MATASEATDAHAPDAVAPPPGNRRFPLLDGMRAVAVLSVVLVHVAVFSEIGSETTRRLLLHLNVGVTIFFLISGFVLYRPFIAHRATGPPRPGAGQYAKRRFLRIVPAYWLVLTVLTILTRHHRRQRRRLASAVRAAAHLDAVGDRSCVSDLSTAASRRPGAWSSSSPSTPSAALRAAAERLARGRSTGGWLRLELVLLAVLAGASVVLHFGVSDGGMPGAIDGTLLGYVLWFGLGMALAVVSVGLEAAGARPRRVSLIAGPPGVSGWRGRSLRGARVCAPADPVPALATASSSPSTSASRSSPCC